MLTNHLNDGIVQALTGLDINASDHSMPLKSSGVVLPVELSGYDTLLTHHLNDGIVPALTGLAIDVGDSKHLLTGNQAALLEADMAVAAKE